jgi:peptide chain release factor subunit 1
MYINEWFIRLGGYFTEHFRNIPGLKGVIVGGPGPTKEDFINGNYLHYELKDKIMAQVDTGYTGPEGIKELVNRSRDLMKDARYYEERKNVQEFLKHLGEDDGLGTYGEQEIFQALKGQNIQLLLISENVRRTVFRLKCKACGHVENKVVENDKAADFESNLSQFKCLKCGGDVEVLEKKDLIEMLIEMAEAANACAELISGNTEEGDMLLRSFGGLAAVTNYRTF